MHNTQRNRFVWRHAVLSCGLAAAVSLAAPSAGRAGPETPSGYVELAARLEGAIEEGRAFDLNLRWSGRHFARGWALAQDCNAYTFNLVNDGLKMVDGRVTGRVVVYGGRSTNFTNVAEFDLDFTVTDGKLSGAYKGRLRPGMEYLWNKRLPGGAVHKEIIEPREGRVSGRVRTLAELQEKQGLAPDKDWPCLKGPYGNGSGIDCGYNLVTSLQDAPVVWRSEAHMPGAYYASRGVKWSPFGGYCLPIVHRGRIYMYYYEGIKPEFKYPTPGLEKVPGEFRTMYNSARARDVVVCIDGATGRTLWKYTLPEGLNFYWTSKRGPMKTMCAWNGRVFYHSGINGKIVCLDAETGDVLWCHDGLPGTRIHRRAIPIMERAGSVPGARDHISDVRGFALPSVVNPALAEGVLVTGGRYSGLFGFDCMTGERLWGPVGPDGQAIRKWSSPLRWVHRGKEYVITMGGFGIEPRTGKVMWRLKLHTGDTLVSASEDYLYAEGAWGTLGEIYRITPEKAELVHEGPWGGSIAGMSIWRGKAYSKPLKGKWGGKITEIDLAAGKLSRFTAPISRTDFAYHPCIADGRLFVEGPQMVIIESNRFEHVGHLVPVRASTAEFSYATGTSPVYSDGRLIYRANDCLICLDLRVHGDLDAYRAMRGTADAELRRELVAETEKRFLMTYIEPNTAVRDLCLELLRYQPEGLEIVAAELDRCIRTRHHPRVIDICDALVMLPPDTDPAIGRKLTPILRKVFTARDVPCWHNAAMATAALDPAQIPDMVRIFIEALTGPQSGRFADVAVGLADLALKLPDKPLRKEAVETAASVLKMLLATGGGAHSPDTLKDALESIGKQGRTSTELAPRMEEDVF